MADMKSRELTSIDQRLTQALEAEQNARRESEHRYLLPKIGLIFFVIVKSNFNL